MPQNNRPTGREKNVVAGTAKVGKGRKVDTTGPVGSGAVRPAAEKASSGNDRMSTTSALGLLGVFMLLPKKLRRTLLPIILVVGAVLLFKSFASGGLTADTDTYSDSYTQTATQDYNTGGLLTDESIVPAVTPAPTPVPTVAPVVQQATASTSTAAITETVASTAREKRVTPIGGGKDTVTVMVYMCGTDLESKYGMGTSDLSEMAKAQISDKVNVIVETGGCRKWKNNIVSSTVNQIYKVETGGLRCIEKDIGSAAMTDPANLTSFIQYCAKNYPADRQVLIFWDHGGGSITGYGYDEKNPSSSSMDLASISKALKDAGEVFDWIGFDACLMATLETALVCNDFADYLIASEETEPGTGWNYTGWLTAISQNTSLPTLTLSKTLIDDFVSSSCASSARAQVTLSIMDLAELQGSVPAAFKEFSSSTNALIASDSYAQVSSARSGVRQFAESSRINQVDLIDLCDRLGTAEAKALSTALRSCIKYNKSTISRAYGVSIYFPYESTSSMKSAISTYKLLGFDEEYSKCIQSFASLGTAGHVASSSSQSLFSGSDDLLGSLLESYMGSSSSSSSYGGSYGSASPLGSLLGSYSNASGASSAGYSVNAGDIMSLLSAFSGRSMPQELDWVDTELVAEQAETISGQVLDPGRITVTEKADGSRVLSLTDEEWALVDNIELNVFCDDGEGFIDLGYDNTFDYDEDGDLLLDWDGTWLTLDGNVCAYYLISAQENDDGTLTSVGRIPCLLNGELMNLRVVFDAEYPTGCIVGAYPLYADETEVEAKGALPLNEGDTIEFICDYYGYDGGYFGSYSLGYEFSYCEDMELANMQLEADSYSVTYRLTDRFGNYLWTPAIDQ